MASRQWTPQQLDAIKARGGTVLVSAAAGSGKTAVLVERVLGRILDSDAPVDADRMLVATFSKAAALEMKERLQKRLGEELARHPENRRLLRQQLLLGRAQIGTIHGFCMEQIRENFQSLGVSCSVRAGDEKEIAVMRREVAEAVAEQFHEQADPVFEQLVELTSVGRDDRRMFDTLFALYDFVRAHPFYQEWLAEKQGYYEKQAPVEETVWGRYILRHARGALSFAAKRLGRALELIDQDEAMKKAYRSAFLTDLCQVEDALAAVEAGDWDEICRTLDRAVPERLGSLRGEHAAKETVTALRKQAREVLTELRERQFCADCAEYEEDRRTLLPVISKLFALTRAFDRQFSQAKREKNIVDFSDMEQMTLELLVENGENGPRPTEHARELSKRFDEILIDEFQDTNAAQELIFRALSRDNLFMVGDVKQSIYRFRQAMPELFMEKKRLFSSYDGEKFPAKIILGKNFRSAPEVTGGVNFFFSLLMSEEMGEIDYNGEEALTAGTSFPPADFPRGIHIHVLDPSQYQGQRDKIALEAAQVAEKIARMLEGGFTVADGGRLRRAEPRDICILLRSAAGKAKIYQDALRKLGVPAWSEPKGGFLDTKEIAPVLAMLRVVENPLMDIELTAALIGIGAFSADEVARMRVKKRKGSLYFALCAQAEEGNEKSAAFLELLGDLRRLAAMGTADEVIRALYELTGYPGRVQVMRSGELRRANLLLLVSYAQSAHASGYKGLCGFLDFIRRLQERGEDFAPAAGLSEQANVVRIMSIHHSKGLEFPIVFLSGCGKEFNRESLRRETILHSDMGFACVRRDLRLMKQFSTVPLAAARLAAERSNLSEELRVLYVALTRAKEYIFITGMLAKAEQALPKYAEELTAEGKLPAYQLGDAKSFLEWMLMAAAHHPELAERFGVQGGAAAEAGLTLTVTPLTDDPEESCRLEQPPLPPPDPALQGILRAQLDFTYPYGAQTRIPTKLAVSQIAKGDGEKAFRFARRPAFLEKGGLSGAQRGQALHKFMQFADYRQAARNPEREFARLVERGFLSKAEADAVNRKKLASFFASNLAQRIFATEKVYRELRFLYEAGEETIGRYTGLLEGDNQAKTALQGIADCVFIEEGRAVIVDYKTDRVKTPEDLVRLYQAQVELYRRVLGESLGVPIKECVLYSFSLSREIAIPGC